jgi:hypothetical protein
MTIIHWFWFILLWLVLWWTFPQICLILSPLRWVSVVFFASLLETTFFFQIYMHNRFFPRSTQINALSLNSNEKNPANINLICITYTPYHYEMCAILFLLYRWINWGKRGQETFAWGQPDSEVRIQCQVVWLPSWNSLLLVRGRIGEGKQQANAVIDSESEICTQANGLVRHWRQSTEGSWLSECIVHCFDMNWDVNEQM